MLHTPVQRKVDILFIHGLGGTSLRTWCHKRDLENLWPELWLPHEPELSNARILTFGYNANFSARKDHTILTIGDFAKDLLYQMKHCEDGPERVGQVPLIVVAHSMGGLVFKKAFVHGHLDDEYRDIISNVKAVLFLATPHRGTDLATTLNKILTSSIFGHSSKDYVAELASKSPTIDDLNESFRHHASNVQIFSFYETLSTNVGPMSFMILEKQSSVLGYPKEISQPLIANHHNVCKFESVDDPNYVSVKGALRRIIPTIQPHEGNDKGFEEDLLQVTTLLGISGPPEEDLESASAVRKAGTCQSFLDSQELHNLVNADICPVVWVHAPPGSGKSTLCAAVFEHLQDKGHHCSYFFFKHEDHKKRALNNMLRSLAYQMALQLPAYRQKPAGVAKLGLQLQGADSLSIWRRLYLSILPNIEFTERATWVIDAIDESDSSKQVVEFISAVGGFKGSIRVLMFSRPLPSIHQSFQVTKRRVPVVEKVLPPNEHDIRLLVSDEIDYLSATEEFKLATVNEILRRSQGNFLWVSLVLNRVVNCHRQEQVKQVLETIPDGMERLYDRMLSVVANLDMQEDRTLARILLSWATYARTPVTVDELSQLYTTEFRSVMDIRHTASQICGQFVVIDTHNRITLIHQSARDYLEKSTLQSFSLDPETAHEQLFCKCFATLCDGTIRARLETLHTPPPFLHYASTSWAFHLESCAVESDRVLDMLVKFFDGMYPLSWIQYLSMSGHLSDLATVSKVLSSFSGQRKKKAIVQAPISRRLPDLSLIDTWAIDLMKLLVKFGRYLSEEPRAIYKWIPALCPTSSAMYERYSRKSAVTLSVSGLSKTTWDDCLARVSVSSGIACCHAVSPFHYAIAISPYWPTDSIVIRDTNLFKVQRLITTEDPSILFLAFNETGSQLACLGFYQTYVWTLDNWELVREVKNPPISNATEFKYDGTGSLVMVTDHLTVYKLLTTRVDPSQPVSWVRLGPTLLKEPCFPKGVVPKLSSVTLNAECTQLAVICWDSLSIWSLDQPEIQFHLTVPQHVRWSPKIVWHPSGVHILGIAPRVFKWCPLEDIYDEVRLERHEAPPSVIQCSPNGLVFITGDAEGAIKVYDVLRMTVIYKFTSEDGSHNLFFSPDSLRIYDLQRTFCSVWGPSCLVQLAGGVSKWLGESASISEDTRGWCTANIHNNYVLAPIVEDRKDSEITAIAVSNNTDELLAYANSDGAIMLYDLVNNSRQRIAECKSVRVRYIFWDQSQTRLAYRFLNEVVIVKVVIRNTTGQRQFSTETTFIKSGAGDPWTSGGQVLFDDSWNLLLLVSGETSKVVALPGGEVMAEYDMPENEHNFQWMKHPSRPDKLICISSGHVSVFTWKLEKQRCIPLKTAAVWGIWSRHIGSYSPNFLILSTFNMGLRVIPTSSIYSDDPNEQSIPTELIDFPKTTRQAISHPLGILPDERMVFLDRNLWVCTTVLRGGPGAITRHFFVPHDWVTANDISLAQLLPDGTIILPSKGEVAIIRNQIMSE